MFEAKFEDGYIFKVIVDSIKDVVEHANFEVSPQGIRLRAMDASHVALVSLTLSYEGFESYRCDKSQVLGMDIKQLAKFLKFVEAGSPLVLKAGNNASHLNLVNESPKGKVEMSYQLHNLEVDSMEVPEMNYAAKIVLGSSRFSKLVKDMRALDDTLKIRAARDKAILSVHGDSGDLELHLQHNEEEIGDVLARTQIATAEGALLEQQFALNYLDLFCKAS